jgi:hypothetical protein
MVAATAERTPSTVSLDAMERLDRGLDEWRTRIDELLVQVDLAALSVRDELRRRMTITENIYLAARSRLADAHHDAGAAACALGQDVESLLSDLDRTEREVRAVVERG